MHAGRHDVQALASCGVSVVWARFKSCVAATAERLLNSFVGGRVGVARRGLLPWSGGSPVCGASRAGAHGEQFGSRIRCRSRWTEIRTPRDRIGQYDAVDEERAFYIRSPPAFASVSHRELVSCRRAVADVARARFRRGSSTPSKRWSRLCVRGDRMPAARAAHCPGQRDKGRLSNDD